MTQRFKIVESKFRNNIIIFDKLIDEPIIEIAGNNKQLNKLMAKACMLILSCNTDFLKVVEEW